MSGQADVVAFLLDPETHGGAEVVHYETHISHVFVAGERAYKLKKAIRLDFLDFSTVTLREAACRREHQLNHRLSPALYRGVLPITGRPGSFHLGGEGEAADWLVVMTQFDNAHLFDRLARDGKLGGSLIERLADEIAELHARLEVRRDLGGAQYMASSIANVLNALGKAQGAGITPAAAARLRDTLLARVEERAADLERRRRAGKVRFCHGDLHLANICLYEGEPTLFDAIEFDDAIACVDVLYDIAFPVMDLIHHGLPDLANLLQNRYLEAVGDYDGLALMPLFLAARAAIRAMAHGVAVSQMGGDSGKAARARDYFALSEKLLEGGKPRLIAVGGLSGTGKSALARALAPRLSSLPGAIVLRSDAIRKRLFGRAPEQRLAVDAYRGEVSARVYATLYERAAKSLAAGATVIADATFLRPVDRADIAAVAAKAGAPFTGLWLEAPEAVLMGRVTKREGDASDADARVVEMQLGQELGDIGWRRLDASLDRDAVLQLALALIDPSDR